MKIKATQNIQGVKMNTTAVETGNAGKECGKREAYSFSRVSSTNEHSLRRQLKRSAQYALEHGMHLDSSLRATEVSGYRIGDTRNGAMTAFLAAIDSGKVKPGSVMLIGSWHRFSKSGAENVLQFVIQVLSRGVEVVTLVDSKHHTNDSVNRDPSGLMFSLFLAGQTHPGKKS